MVTCYHAASFNGLGGFGNQHNLVEGTTVYGHFRDDDMQDFVVLGVQQGISQSGYFETITDELLSVNKGFNDLKEKRKVLDYDGTADGLNVMVRKDFGIVVLIR